MCVRWSGCDVCVCHLLLRTESAIVTKRSASERVGKAFQSAVLFPQLQQVLQHCRRESCDPNGQAGAGGEEIIRFLGEGDCVIFVFVFAPGTLAVLTYAQMLMSMRVTGTLVSVTMRC